MKDTGSAMVMASFLGDSLALGVHWIYDTGQIEKDYGRVESLLKPRAGSYHATKQEGEFTHYGDQTFVLLESLGAKRGFDLQDFSLRWRDLFADYRGYFDQATRATLGNFSAGKSPMESGSPSHDLSGAARIGPLVFLYASDPTTLVKHARAQTAMTHASQEVVDSAEFFARVCGLVLQGRQPVAAMEAVAEERFSGSVISDWVREGIRSIQGESVPTISRFGQSCHVEDAFPGVVHLIGKYERNLKEGLVQSVTAGGDNAGRAMLVGMTLGAYLGAEALPPEWLSGLKKARQIRELLDLLS